MSNKFTQSTPPFSSPHPQLSVISLGKALRAIKQFGNFVFSRLSEAELDGRIEGFLARKPEVKIQLPIYTLDEAGSEQLAEDILPLRDTVGVDESPIDTSASNRPSVRRDLASLEPLVHYFSARHGFQFEGIGVSLPLQSVSSANTFQWNLTSLTHEYCHVISGVFLAGARDYLGADDQAVYHQLIDEIFKECGRGDSATGALTGRSGLDLFCKTLLYPEIQTKGIKPDEAHNAASQNCTRDYRPENEVMTLVFDLFYFFRGRIQKHLTMYWSHWLNLPGIHADESKLVEYITRSCLALAASYLDSPKDYVPSLRTRVLLDCLADVLSKPESMKKYGVDHVLDLMRQRRVVQVVHRTFLNYFPLLCVAKSVLTSTVARESLWQGLDAETQKRLAAARKTMRIEYDVLTRAYNPLQLICLDSPGPETDEVGSLWLLAVLDAISNVDERTETA